MDEGGELILQLLGYNMDCGCDGKMWRNADSGGNGRWSY